MQTRFPSKRELLSLVDFVHMTGFRAMTTEELTTRFEAHPETVRRWRERAAELGVRVQVVDQGPDLPPAYGTSYSQGMPVLDRWFERLDEERRRKKDEGG